MFTREELESASDDQALESLLAEKQCRLNAEQEALYLQVVDAINQLITLEARYSQPGKANANNARPFVANRICFALRLAREAVHVAWRHGNYPFAVHDASFDELAAALADLTESSC